MLTALNEMLVLEILAEIDGREMSRDYSAGATDTVTLVSSDGVSFTVDKARLGVLSSVFGYA